MSAIAGEIVEPYAQALMSLAQSKNITNEIGDNVRDLLNFAQNTPEFRQFLANPIVNREDKKAVLNRVIGDTVNPYMRNFLMLLVDRGRALFFGQIGQQYLVLLRKLNQTVLAEVTSASDLNDHQRGILVEKVKNFTGAHQVELETKVDPEILGGVIIKVGSQILDASLRGQLRRIGMSLNIG
ncbi:MAG: F0F1 ATP synthase subunit delta [Oscillatoriales cyanobacterium RM2_1_1]|nr:F0F1 ATP synthase subunit delta [Oscillatoriales cyanobacterium SM2_3_0]NJO45122.1 F0F1 ATP synthase subunit delta [Oscillatoriales cyanobacterium RM2_1_1]